MKTTTEQIVAIKGKGETMTKTITETAGAAYHTGYEAANQGEPRTANPYAVGTWEAGEWDRGWADGN